MPAPRQIHESEMFAIAPQPIDVRPQKPIPGINIQWPWSQLIADSKKSIETRTYAIPQKYLGVPLALIETPGPRGKALASIDKARIIGLVRFDRCFKFRDKKHWDESFDQHQVPLDDPHYAFTPQKPKFGWVVGEFKALSKNKPAPKKRGIVFALNCYLSSP